MMKRETLDKLVIFLFTLLISSFSTAIQILDINHKTNFQVDIHSLIRENGYRVSCHIF